MTEEILSAQGLSWTQLGLAAVILIVLLWQGYRWMLYPIPQSQKTLLLTCRILWTFLLLWCIWDPVLQKTQTHKRKVLPKVIALVDQSSSMSLQDNAATNRETKLRSILNKLKTTFAESEVKDSLWLGMGSSVRPLPNPPTFQDPQSLILKSLQEVAEQYTDSQTPSALFLLTDGQDTAEAHISSVLPSLRAHKTQVYPIIWKELSQIPLFVRIERINAPNEVLINHTFDLQSEIRIRAPTSLDLDVILSANGKEVSRQNYPQAKNGTIRTSFSLTSDQSGLCLYTVTVKEAKNDTALTSLSTSVRFKTQEKIKIFYVQGKLDWEFRYILGAVKDNPSFQLDAMHQLNNESNLYQAGSKNDPLTSIDIPTSIKTAADRYHVIVLKNVSKKNIDQDSQKALLDLVQKKGGGILFYSGNTVEAASLKDTLLEELLPVVFEPASQEDKADSEFSKKFTSQFGTKHTQKSDTPTSNAPNEPQFSLKISEEGIGSEIWRDATTHQAALPEPPKTFDYFVKIQNIKPGAMLLGVQREDPHHRPLFASQNIGAGRSAFLGIDGLKRWRMGKDANIRDYDRFWQQLFLWLGGRIQTTTLETHKTRYQPGETAQITFQTQTPDPEYQLTVRNPSGVEDSIPLKWNKEATTGTAEYPIHSTGEHILTVKKKSDILAQNMIDSTSTNLEREYSGLNETLLQQLAQETGGRCIDPSEFHIIPELLKQREETYTERQRTSLWHSPWIFLGILIFYCIELMLRRRFLLT